MKITRAEFLAGLAASAALPGQSAMAQAVVPKPKPIPVARPGINLSSAEYGNADSKMGYGYIYPNNTFFQNYAALGFKLVRLPFKLQRLQPVIKGPLDAANLAEITRCVAAAKANNQMIVLDAHNYGKRGTVILTEADLSDFWAKVATAFKAQPHVAYGLMNEPAAFKPPEWRKVVDATVRAIRAKGSTQLLMVPGAGWNGAHSWVSGGNAAAFDSFTDTNFMFEVHQYLDNDSSGTHHDQYTPGSGSTRLKAVTDWARWRGKKLFLGEFGFALPAGEVEARALMQYMTDNSDVWAAHAYWAGGPWWGSYPYSSEPKGGTPNPQVALMKGYF
jgi:endoglucanase